MTNLRNGDVLDGRFKIVKLLGKGGFGEVYEAWQLVFGQNMRRVALKLFLADYVQSDNIYETFHDAIVLLQLQEESPVLTWEDQKVPVRDRMLEVYDIGVLEKPVKRAFMTTRLVPTGNTLEHELRKYRKQGMHVEATLHYLRGILIPLAWMHSLENGMIHGDLKPANILLNEAYQPVLADFGLTASVDIGVLGGTLTYYAPEQLTNLRGSRASDIYALGLIWYEMLTGRNPFTDVDLQQLADGADQHEIMQVHREARSWPYQSDDGKTMARIVPVEEINSEWNEHPILHNILRKCIHPQASQRYLSAMPLLIDIDRYLRTGTLDKEIVVTNGNGSQKKESDCEQAQEHQRCLNNANAFLQQNKWDEALAAIEPVLAIENNPQNGLYIAQAIEIQLKAKPPCENLSESEGNRIIERLDQLNLPNHRRMTLMADAYDSMGKPHLADAIIAARRMK